MVLVVPKWVVDGVAVGVVLSLGASLISWLFISALPCRISVRVVELNFPLYLIMRRYGLVITVLATVARALVEDLFTIWISVKLFGPKYLYLAVVLYLFWALAHAQYPLLIRFMQWVVAVVVLAIAHILLGSNPYAVAVACTVRHVIHDVGVLLLMRDIAGRCRIRVMPVIKVKRVKERTIP